MKHHHNGQQLDLSDPIVAKFALECGLATNAVSIRIIGVSRDDLQVQIARLERSFGRLIMMTEPRQSGRSTEWIAYGTIVG